MLLATVLMYIFVDLKTFNIAITYNLFVRAIEFGSATQTRMHQMRERDTLSERDCERDRDGETETETMYCFGIFLNRNEKLFLAHFNHNSSCL